MRILPPTGVFLQKEELKFEAAAWNTSRKNSNLWKLAEHTNMEYTAKAAMVDMLTDLAC